MGTYPTPHCFIHYPLLRYGTILSESQLLQLVLEPLHVLQLLIHDKHVPDDAKVPSGQLEIQNLLYNKG